MAYRIESLLSARLYVAPQLAEDRVYFVSDLNGKLSLYAMDANGSVPELLTPPDIALPNPHHLEGSLAFKPLPGFGKILLMLDHNGDENYQPCLLPIEGGTPVPAFGDRFAGQQVTCAHVDTETLDILFVVDPRDAPLYTFWRGNLRTGDLTALHSTEYGGAEGAWNDDLTEMVFAEGYTAGDTVLYHWHEESGIRLLYGKPINQRAEGEEVPLNGINGFERTQENRLLLISTLFEDTYSLGLLDLDGDSEIQSVGIAGERHTGVGELVRIHRLEDKPFRNRFAVEYNIDGSTWLYEGTLDEEYRNFNVDRVLCGEGMLSGGVLEAWDHDEETNRYVLSFSTATSPSQIYRLDPGDLDDEVVVKRLTNERVLGIPDGALAPGEDASYRSFDGERISARLYLPAMDLGHPAPYPVIFYIHGGPQSQERPDFTWFSMPLIQFFTLNGFAVWVPNVRGSSGYGLAYQKQVDNDWGGKDRLDHVEAFQHLHSDPRLDMSRVGVMGRSYGGYMTLRLITKHPTMFGAAVDMFGPYNLLTFIERLPPSWQVYFRLAVGDPEKDREQLIEQSPSTLIDEVECPLLIMQGANDPRVVEQESRDVADKMRANGKVVDYVVFEDEGHDVIRYANKVRCYNTIVDFFRQHLMKEDGA